MDIVITSHSLRDVDALMDDLVDRYPSIIKSCQKQNRRLTLANGDLIRGYSNTARHKDGLRADVAIGYEAEIYTVASKVSEPVWTLDKLDQYLDSLVLKVRS